MSDGWEKYLIPYGEGPEEQYELWLKELDHPFALRVVQIDDPERKDEYNGELVTKLETDHKSDLGDDPAEPEEGEPPLWAFGVSDPIYEVHHKGTSEGAIQKLEAHCIDLFDTCLHKLNS